MNKNIENIISMKKETNNIGINAYEWYFSNLENNHISKLDGTSRNASMIEHYDIETKTYIITQLFYINKEAAIDLMKHLNIEKLDVDETYYNHIEKQE